jgi:uncharacterized membrane-anchored protein YitT (DUF2179 family)
LGFLIAYVIGFLVISSIKIYSAPDYINSTKVILSSLFYPLHILFYLVNIPLFFIGVHLQFNSTIILNEKEKKIMTDKTIEDLSDALAILKQKEDEDE